MASLKYFLALLFFASTAAAQLPSFPECQGEGCGAIAGNPTRGGTSTVCHVDRLDGASVNGGSTTGICTGVSNCARGSLAYCISGSNRHIVFDLSGVIQVNNNLNATGNNISVNFQTAPLPGIIVKQATLRISGHDQIWRHPRFYTGNGSGSPTLESRDAVRFEAGSYNIVWDFGIARFSVDEAQSICNGETCTTPAHHITWQRSIIADALNAAGHPDGNHSMGTLLGEGAHHLSIHNCLWINDQQRNIRIRGVYSSQFINNLIYNWGGCTGCNFDGEDSHGEILSWDVIGNSYIKGPDTGNNSNRIIRWTNPAPPAGSKLHMAHNICPNRSTDTGDEWLCVESGNPSTSIRENTAQFTSALYPITIETDPVVARRRLSDLTFVAVRKIGPFPYARDMQAAASWEKSLLDQIPTGASPGLGSGNIVDCITGCGDPALASNPTITSQVVPYVPPANKDTVSANGYTNIENDLTAKAGVAENGGSVPTPTPTPTPTFTPTAGATPTPTNTPSAPTPTPTNTPTPTFTPTAEPQPTAPNPPPIPGGFAPPRFGSALGLQKNARGFKRQ